MFDYMCRIPYCMKHMFDFPSRSALVRVPFPLSLSDGGEAGPTRDPSSRRQRADPAVLPVKYSTSLFPSYNFLLSNLPPPNFLPSTYIYLRFSFIQSLFPQNTHQKNIQEASHQPTNLNLPLQAGPNDAIVCCTKRQQCEYLIDTFQFLY